MRQAILEELGFQITSIKYNWIFETDVITATKSTGRGDIEIMWGHQCARVTKPNGTIKWYYEKTDKQVRRALIQAIEFYA